MIVYRFTCRTNGKVYVGQTKRSLRVRFGQHCAAARRGSRLPFHRALRKHGRDNFDPEIILESDDRSAIDHHEIAEIARARESGTGCYNVAQGGAGLRTRGLWRHTEGAKRAIAAANLGKRLLQGARERIRELTRDAITDDLRRTIAERTRAALAAPAFREKMRAHVWGKTSKPILQLTPDGRLVAEHPSAREASRRTGVITVTCARWHGRRWAWRAVSPGAT